MITLSEDALALIEQKKVPIHIEIPRSVSGCCIEVTDRPSVSFGEPKQRAEYVQQSIQGVTVYVPSCFPEVPHFTIRASSFLGFKRLVLDGWRLA